MILRSFRAMFSRTITVFDKIIDGSLPSKRVFEDEEFYAFEDIDPQAPTHILIIPKIKGRLTGISKAEAEDGDLLGRLLLTAKKIADEKKLGGYRLVINEGKEGGQSVDHLHLHLIGGRNMKWPPG